MKANLKEILESIPDYDDFMKLASDIGSLSLKKMRLENDIKKEESTTFIKAVNELRIDGKRPSVSHIENAYMHSGIDGEILQLRDDLAYVMAELDEKRIKLSIYKDMIGLFQTVSANERNSGF